MNSQERKMVALLEKDLCGVKERSAELLVIATFLKSRSEILQDRVNNFLATSGEPVSHKVKSPSLAAAKPIVAKRTYNKSKVTGMSTGAMGKGTQFQPPLPHSPPPLSPQENFSQEDGYGGQPSPIREEHLEQ
jgi:hypothetical protein